MIRFLHVPHVPSLPRSVACAAAAVVALLACLFVSAGPVAAERWHGALQGGGSLQVDPRTHRAVRDYDGVERPAWDGVHRLQDGSTVIIRDGIAVPTEQMYRAWEGGGGAQATFAERYCDQLARKTCGFDNACRTAAACLQARSLRADEVREQAGRSARVGGPAQAPTGERCRVALTDPGFPPCRSLEAAAGDSRCRALVDQACGVDGGCSGSQACDAARQLLNMETEERLVNDNPAVMSATGQQCLEALGNPFFVRCGAGSGQ